MIRAEELNGNFFFLQYATLELKKPNFIKNSLFLVGGNATKHMNDSFCAQATPSVCSLLTKMLPPSKSPKAHWSIR